MFENLPYKAAAVVIWLPEGETPKADDFRISDDKEKSPPYPNPEAWWELGQAVVNARTVDRMGHTKVPWIKVGETVLNPDDVLRAYEHFKARAS